MFTQKVGTKAAQTKSHTQTPLINIPRLRPSADAYGFSVDTTSYQLVFSVRSFIDRNSQPLTTFL
jgi:hypothetical protein